MIGTRKPSHESNIFEFQIKFPESNHLRKTIFTPSSTNKLYKSDAFLKTLDFDFLQIDFHTNLIFKNIFLLGFTYEW